MKKKLYTQWEVVNEHIELRKKIKHDHVNYTVCPKCFEINYPGDAK